MFATQMHGDGFLLGDWLNCCRMDCASPVAAFYATCALTKLRGGARMKQI